MSLKAYLYEPDRLNTIEFEIDGLTDAMQDAAQIIQNNQTFNFYNGEVQYLKKPFQKRFLNWLHILLDEASIGAFENLFKHVLHLFTNYNSKYWLSIDEENTAQYIFTKILKRRNGNLNLSEKDSQLLFKLILFAAKYPGLLRQSFINQFLNAPRFIDFQFLKEVFENCFCKYEFPVLLFNIMPTSKLENFELFAQILTGVNYRHINKSKHKLSKKEAHYINKPATIFKDKKNKMGWEKLDQFLILAAAANNENLAAEILMHRLFMQFNHERFTANRTRLCKMAKWISINQGELQCGLNNLLDFLLDQEQRELSLSGRTANSIQRLLGEYHVNMGHTTYVAPNYDLTAKWKRLHEKAITIEFDGNTYNVSEINTAKKLQLESSVMKHCVLSYVNDCTAGSCRIYSVKNEFEQHLLTIETRNNKVTQIAGKCNRMPTPEEVQLVKIWEVELKAAIDQALEDSQSFDEVKEENLV